MCCNQCHKSNHLIFLLLKLEIGAMKNTNRCDHETLTTTVKQQLFNFQFSSHSPTFSNAYEIEHPDRGRQCVSELKLYADRTDRTVQRVVDFPSDAGLMWKPKLIYKQVATDRPYLMSISRKRAMSHKQFEGTNFAFKKNALPSSLRKERVKTKKDNCRQKRISSTTAIKDQLPDYSIGLVKTVRKQVINFNLKHLIQKRKTSRPDSQNSSLSRLNPLTLYQAPSKLNNPPSQPYHSTKLYFNDNDNNKFDHHLIMVQSNLIAPRAYIRTASFLRNNNSVGRREIKKFNRKCIQILED